MASKVYSEEQLNYFRVCHIATDILPQALRLLFKQEWDNRYKASLGEWKDAPQNGLDFKNGESPANQKRHSRLLATMVNGDRAQWDCTMLFYAILYSDSIAGHGLSPLIRSNVDDLRKFRNEDYAHMTEGQLSNADFKITVAKVETAFRALGLSTVEIQTVSKQKSFPTDELQNVKTSNQKLTQDLQTKFSELQEKDTKLQEKTKELLEKDIEFQEEKDKFEGKEAELQDRLKTTEEQRKLFEEQLQRKVEPFCVLPPRPPHVIASRDYHVDKVTQKLLNLRNANENTLSYCYISGNPGSGKSQLAGLVAEKYYKETSEDTTAPSFVMTLSAENPEALLTSYLSLARKMNCPESTINITENSKDLNNERKIAIIKDLIATKIHLYSSWLLVIDNVTNLPWIGQFLPQRGNDQWGKGQLLITTQDCSCIPPDSSFLSQISISKGMEPADAICLLTELSGITDNDMGENVAHALDCQPLALANAGVYVRKVRDTNQNFGWEGYLEKLEKGKRELTEEELAKVNSIYPNSMTVATKIALETVMGSNEIMKHAFTFLAFCAPEPLRLDVLTNYVVNADGELDEEDIGIQIQGSSLLLIEKADDVNIRLHKVVHDIVKSLVKDQMEANEHVRVACVAIGSCSQYIHKAIREKLQGVDALCGSRHIVPHLRTLAVGITNIISTEEKFVLIKNTILNMHNSIDNFEVLGLVCIFHGEYLFAMKYFSVALKLREDNMIRTGPDHEHVKRVAHTYHYMGFLHMELSNLQQAKENYERALSLQLNTLGPDHVDVAHTYLNMGNLRRMLGDNLQAKEYFEHALSISLSKLGPDHVDVASIYHSMGILHCNLGDNQQAKKYYECALSIRLNKLGPDHVDVAYTYHMMGNLHSILGDHQQAKEYYERALSIRLNKLGPDHFTVAITYHAMGNLHGRLGDYQQAKKYHERALSIKLDKLGADHADVATSYHDMGTLHSMLGDNQQAEESYKRALFIRLNRLGSDHADIAYSYHSMGTLHSKLGDNQQAKEYYERALSIQLDKLGPDHLEVGRSYHDMGILHGKLGDNQQAKEYYERALSIQLDKLGPDHLEVGRSYHDMGILHGKLGDNQQAKEYYERALSILLDKLGPDHVDVATTCLHMSVLHSNLGDNEQAKNYFERAKPILLNLFGFENVDVASTYRNMGITHHILGNIQHAKDYCGRALSIRLNELGPDHVDVARSYHDMGILHGKLGDNQQAKEYYERALSIRLDKLGPDHVDVASTCLNMSVLHRNLGDNEQAKNYFELSQSILLNKLRLFSITLESTLQPG